MCPDWGWEMNLQPTYVPFGAQADALSLSNTSQCKHLSLNQRNQSLLKFSTLTIWGDWNLNSSNGSIPSSQSFLLSMLHDPLLVLTLILSSPPCLILHFIFTPHGYFLICLFIHSSNIESLSCTRHCTRHWKPWIYILHNSLQSTQIHKGSLHRTQGPG